MCKLRLYDKAIILCLQDHAHDLLDASQYHRLLRMLCEQSKPAKMALLDVAVSSVRAELRQLKKCVALDSMTIDTLTADTLADFDWHGFTEEMREKCPWTTTLIDASLPCPTQLTIPR